MAALPSRSLPSAPLDPHHRRRVALASGLAVLWCVFTLLAQFSGALDEFEQPLIDWRQAIHALPVPPSNQLALVAIDKIPEDRPWPWSRLDYSLILRSLIDYAPQSVVFEMNLNDRDPSYTSFDDTFSHIVERSNIVVFAATGLTSGDTAFVPPKLGSMPFHGDARFIPRFKSAIWPLDTFAGQSPVGANNLQADAGLRLRRLPLVFILGDSMVPSLVLQAAAQFLGADLASSEVQIGRAIFLRRKDGHLLRAIPIDNLGRMSIRYHAGAMTSWQASFDNVLVYDDQLQHNIQPQHDLRELARRQVWIGRIDAGMRERFQTPLGEMTRLEVQLQAERTILDQDYVRPLPPMILAALYLLIATGVATVLIEFGLFHAGAMLVILSAFWIELSLLVFRLYNVVLPIPSFAMLLFGAFAVGLLARYWDMEPDSDRSSPSA